MDGCGLGSELVKRLEKDGQDVIAVEIGETFKKVNDHGFIIDPGESNNYIELFNELRDVENIPTTIIHLLSVTDAIEE